MSYKIIGKSIPRVDGIDKVTGEGKYIADIKIPGMLYVKVLRSTQAHAKILNIDKEEALKIDGVKNVITGENLDYLIGDCIVDQPILAKNKVRFIGEPVAAVVGKTPYVALEGVEKIKVEYEPLKPVFDPREAIKEDAPIIHEKLGEYKHIPTFEPIPNTNIFYHYKLRKGDIEKGFKQADFIIENQFEFPHLSHTQLEPHGTIALWNYNDEIQIWTSAQSPFFVRNAISHIFGVPHSKIKVVVPYVGGGFGGKSDVTIEPLVVLVAKFMKGKPVRLILEREEMFEGTVLGRGLYSKIKSGVTKDGKIVAEEIEAIFHAGAYGDYALNIAKGGGHNAAGPYDIPNLYIDSFGVYTNTPPVGAYRAYGHPEVHFAKERQLDIIAEKLKIDPIQLRLKNILKPGSINALGQKINYETGNLEECIKRVSIELDDEKYLTPKNNYTKIGKGLAAFMKSPVMPTNAASSVIIKFNEDASVNLTLCSVDMGQGSLTVFTQIAAEALKLPFEKVHVSRIYDAEFAPYDWQTVASRATMMTGNAILIAASKAINRLKELASQVLCVNIDELDYDGKRVFIKESDKGIDIKDLVMGYRFPDGHTIGGPVSAYGSYIVEGVTNPDRETGQGNIVASWTFGCQGAILEINTKTGEIQVLKLVTAIDAGKIINPKLAHEQIVGAMIQAMGGVLYEKIIYSSEGKIRNPTLTDYKIPTPQDVHSIDCKVIFIETEDPLCPYGAKCLGEHGCVGIPAAILNAIYNAIGVQFLKASVTAEDIINSLS